MENQVLLSYIVPIYNMECYLRQCIDSILMQGVEAQEIILVNDGSTDSSLSICREYEMKYPFVRVIDKQNGGISSARNMGLQTAIGKYVCFVDSDDYFIDNFAKTFLGICEKENADIIRGWYSLFEEETNTFLSHERPSMSYVNMITTGKDYLLRSVNEQTNEVVPWLGFFRREFLIKHKICFPDGIAYEEDHLFFLNTLLCDDFCRVYQSDIEFYAYRKRVGSATKTPTLKQVADIVQVVEEETKLIKAYNISGDAKEAALRYICSSFYQLTSIYGRLPKEIADKAVRCTPRWMARQCIRHPYNRHQQIKIFLFTYFRGVVDFVYKWKLR